MAKSQLGCGVKDDRSKFVTTRGEFRWNPETERFETVEREGYWYDGPWALAHTNPNWVAENYLFRNDDGTLVTATNIVGGGENTVVLGTDGVDPGDKFRLRMDWGDDANADSNNVGSVLIQYRVNAGAGFGSWTQVPTTAGVDRIALVTSDQSITDGDNDATQRLSGVPGSTVQTGWNEYDENNSLTSRTWTDDFAEFEYCLELSANTDGYIYEFRPVLSAGDAPDAQTNVPSLTVSGTLRGSEPHIVHYRFALDNNPGSTTGFSHESNTDFPLQGSEDTPFTPDLDTKYAIILKVANLGSATTNSIWQIQYNIDGAGWNDIGNATTGCEMESGSDDDGAFQTSVERLTSSGRTFDQSRYEDTTGNLGAISLNVEEEFEGYWSIIFDSADLSGGESITFRTQTDTDDVISILDVTPTANIAGGAIPHPYHIIKEVRRLMNQLITQ